MAARACIASTGSERKVPRVSASTLAVRNRRMAEQRARGVPVKDIAKAENLTVRGVYKTIREHGAAADADADLSAQDIVMEIIDAHLESLHNVRGHHENRVEATHLARAVAQVGQSLVGILDRCGRLPGVEVQRDGSIIESLVREFIEVLLVHRIPEEHAVEALGRVQERWGQIGLRTRNHVPDRPSWIGADENQRRAEAMYAMLARVAGGQVTFAEAFAELEEHRGP
jgi:hypothetical protein